jgi:dTDP-4-amino-4,6-dideoxygalactose transaminase
MMERPSVARLPTVLSHLGCRLGYGYSFGLRVIVDSVFCGENAVNVSFNQPYLTGRELQFISEAHAAGHLAGDGLFTRRCSDWLESEIGCSKALLTHSCTAALEIAALLAEVGPGDEVIMPSYTFVSTANAFVLRGATPVFVDIREDTLNLDEKLLEQAITDRTRAIVPVHYAGVACEMDTINDIAREHGLLVIEDAAQGIMSTYKGRPLGGIGDLGALSFHETKNITCGEGGALLVDDSRLADRAEIIREKGTNRAQFFRGHVDKYTWVDIGSSYLTSELSAAFLWAQILEVRGITDRRLALWQRYHDAFEAAEKSGLLRRPIVPEHCSHNAHMYYLLLHDLDARTRFIDHMSAAGIGCVFHYVPLHQSPAGREYGCCATEMEVTEDLSERLVRLPLWVGLEPEQDRVICQALEALNTE